MAAPGLGTFAVDRSWRLYLDPELLTGAGRWDATTVGAVLAKILVLVAIILFIQKRPRGLFALKGRAVEA